MLSSILLFLPPPTIKHLRFPTAPNDKRLLSKRLWHCSDYYPRGGLDDKRHDVGDSGIHHQPMGRQGRCYRRWPRRGEWFFKSFNSIVIIIIIIRPNLILLQTLQSAIAILNDSWIVVAKLDRALGFNPLSPARALLHDLFALAISLGGIVMIIFSRYTYQADGFAALESDSSPQITGSAGETDVISREGFSQNKMLSVAVWMLTAVV